MCGKGHGRPQKDISADEANETVERLIAAIPSENRELVRKLLDEVKALNYLNLNLEVKYSFKGFAGLMHILVFFACKEATGIDIDVYAMLTALLKQEERK